MTRRWTILVMAVLATMALAGGLRAITNQSLDEFEVSQEVEADQAVPFPVDI